MKRFFFKTKRRTVATLAAALMIIGGGSALAAILVFSGADGSASGQIENAQVSKAATITGTSTPVLVRGAATLVPVSIKNNDASQGHTLSTGTTAVFTTTPTASCASSLALDTTQGILSAPVPLAAGATVTGNAVVTVAAALPSSCAGAAWTATFSGTTTTP